MTQEEILIINMQAAGVLALLTNMHAKLAHQGCDQRAVLVALTDYMARIIAEGAIPGQLTVLLEATQQSLAEKVLGVAWVAGNG